MHNRNSIFTTSPRSVDNLHVGLQTCPRTLTKSSSRTCLHCRTSFLASSERIWLRPVADWLHVHCKHNVYKVAHMIGSTAEINIWVKPIITCYRSITWLEALRVRYRCVLISGTLVTWRMKLKSREALQTSRIFGGSSSLELRVDLWCLPSTGIHFSFPLTGVLQSDFSFVSTVSAHLL